MFITTAACANAAHDLKHLTQVKLTLFDSGKNGLWYLIPLLVRVCDLSVSCNKPVSFHLKPVAPQR